MHVLLYHDAVIPPPKYGGTERIVFWLARALVQLGHRVTVLARPGSQVEGATVLPLPSGLAPAAWTRLVPDDVELIHLWGTPSQAEVAGLNRPFLVTIQGNGRPGERFHPNTVFISRSHARNHGSSAFVHNGLDPAEYPCDAEREDYLVFLAKASWKVKNLAGAIEIARASRRRLEVLGSRDWPLGLQRRLPAWRGVRYHGMVGDVEKCALLRRAHALLFPVRWPEPFGIAITEALACGAPVFGTPYGSLPEIVTADCGVLSDRAEELVRALAEKRFPPQACRDRVLLHGFTHLDMARGYLRHYASVLEHGKLAAEASPAPPQALFREPAETLLPWVPLGAGLRSVPRR